MSQSQSPTQPAGQESPCKPSNKNDRWVKFPDGLKLASLPNFKSEACPSCGAGQYETHGRDCPEELCPRCLRVKPKCKCHRTSPFKPWGSIEQLNRELNSLASALTGHPTAIDMLGHPSPMVKVKKVRALTMAWELKKASDYIMKHFSEVQLEAWKYTGTAPRIIAQASIMKKQATAVWMEYFWK